MKTIINNRQVKLQQLVQDFNRIDQIVELMPILKKMNLIDIVQTLSMMSNHLVIAVLNEFDYKQQGIFFSEFNLLKQLSYFQQLDKKKFAILFENMHYDDRVNLFQILTQNEQSELLPYLKKPIHQEILSLNSFSINTAGGIMNSGFDTIKKDMSCFEALVKITQDNRLQKANYQLYVVNENQKMEGYVTLKDLQIATPTTLVSQIVNNNFVYGDVKESTESIEKKIDKYKIFTIPILNNNKQLVGIVIRDSTNDLIKEQVNDKLEIFETITSIHKEKRYKNVIMNQFSKFRNLLKSFF